MTEQTIIADAYSKTSWEDFPCLECGKLLTLYYNGGELEERICCGVTYRGRAKGFEVIAHLP